MNRTNFENTDTDTDAAANEYRAEVEECVRRNPGSALLVAVGAGVAIALLVRALRPAPTPQERITQVLEDIESRLRDLASPVLRRASAMASEGLEAAQHGEAKAERFLGDAARRLRRLFS
jgi:ElaB/YqjD/DUF883 family membrane-anchored ribosome-binding protein